MARPFAPDFVPADKLEQMGIVYRVFDDAAFAEEVGAFARRLAAGPSA